MGARLSSFGSATRDNGRWHVLVNIGMALLAAVTLALVIVALRDDPAPAPDPAAAELLPSPIGTELDTTPSAAPSATPTPASDQVTPVLLAGAPGALWRWVGPIGCAAAAPSGSLSRSSDGDSWAPVTPPGTAVASLDASSADVAVATVYDPACTKTVVATGDGGATWDVVDSSGALSHVSLGRAGGKWALLDGDVVRESDDAYAATESPPCTGSAVGPPSLVTAISGPEAYVLCQGRDGAGRLLVRTRDAGQTWLRLAGKLARSGLNGAGIVTTLHVGSPERAAVLVHGAGCPGGEIRVTANAGAKWTTLKCVTVGNRPVGGPLLDLVVGADGSLIAAAWAGRVKMLRSADGAVWAEITA